MRRPVNSPACLAHCWCPWRVCGLFRRTIPHCHTVLHVSRIVERVFSLEKQKFTKLIVASVAPTLLIFFPMLLAIRSMAHFWLATPGAITLPKFPNMISPAMFRGVAVPTEPANFKGFGIVIMMFLRSLRPTLLAWLLH